MRQEGYSLPFVANLSEEFTYQCILLIQGCYTSKINYYNILAEELDLKGLYKTHGSVDILKKIIHDLLPLCFMNKSI